jgi:flavin reductase (DIM6/NTAB) family NADH-FMN oxidoreductase RutF
MKNDPQHQLGAALGRVPSGLFILTARRGDAETAMLTSWVQQCSLKPPLVSVAVRRDRPIAPWLTDGSTFVLNILEDGQTEMVAHFGRGFPLGTPAFEEIDLERTDDSTPILSEALAYLQCRVIGRTAAADHDVLIAEVIAGRMLSDDGRPMIHVRKSGLHY